MSPCIRKQIHGYDFCAALIYRRSDIHAARNRLEQDRAQEDIDEMPFPLAAKFFRDMRVNAAPESGLLIAAMEMAQDFCLPRRCTAQLRVITFHLISCRERPDKDAKRDKDGGSVPNFKG